MKRIVFASIFCLWSSFALAQYLAPLGNSGGGSSSISFPATVSGTVNSGGIPYFSSSTAMASSAALTANALVIGGGAGEPPASASGLTYVGGQLLAPNGTISAPTYSFSSELTSGLTYATSPISTASIVLAAAGSCYYADQYGVFGFQYGCGQSYHSSIQFGSGSGYDLQLIPSPAIGAQNLDIGTSYNSSSPGPLGINFEGAINGQASNLAGTNVTFNGSPSTGTGAGGDLIFATTPPGSSGTSTNPEVSALTIKGTTGYIELNVTPATDTPSSGDKYLCYNSSTGAIELANTGTCS